MNVFSVQLHVFALTLMENVFFLLDHHPAALNKFFHRVV